MSTTNNNIDTPTKIKDVDIPKDINVNIPQNKNVNIPSDNVNIPSSQTNKPNYNPSSIY